MTVAAPHHVFDVIVSETEVSSSHRAQFEDLELAYLTMRLLARRRTSSG